MSFDPRSITRAHVYLRDALAGTLQKVATDEFRFTYDQTFIAQSPALGISLRLPPRAQPYVWSRLPPFFDNLVFEGWLLRSAERHFKLDRRDDAARFALLMASGRAPIGAVSVVPLDKDGHEIPPDGGIAKELQGLTLRPLQNPYTDCCPSCLLPVKKPGMHPKCTMALWGTTRAINLAIDEHDPMAVFRRFTRAASISGAQKKGLFGLAGKTELTLAAEELDYIVKPDGDEPEMPANEHLTMAIARRLKFESPPCALLETDALGHLYIVRRFDRTAGRKLLMEDMAQLCDESSTDKYEGSFAGVAERIRAFGSAPGVQLAELFRRMLFCFLTGNGDMHLKNWSLLEMPASPGAFKLSPVYDLLNVRASMPTDQIEMGLYLNGKRSDLSGRDFRDFAVGELRLNERIVDRYFAELGQWRATAEEMVPRSLLTPARQSRYLGVVSERFERLARG